MEPQDVRIIFNAHIFCPIVIAEERMTMKQARYKLCLELSSLLGDLLGGDVEITILVVTPEIAERGIRRQTHDVDIFCQAYITSSALIVHHLMCAQEANKVAQLLIWQRLRDLFKGEVDIDLSVDTPQTA